MDACTENKQTRLTFSDMNWPDSFMVSRMGHLKRLADLLGIVVHARGNTVHLNGEEMAVDLSRRVLEQLYGLLKEKYPVFPNDVDYAFVSYARTTRQT
jgi:phosphate starvation-inducible PhoH-like protein